MATMFIPAHTVDVEDPQVEVARAFKDGTIGMFSAMHDDRDPENPIVRWIMRLNDGSRLEWVQSEKVTPYVESMLHSFNRGSMIPIGIIHTTWDGVYVRETEV